MGRQSGFEIQKRLDDGSYTDPIEIAYFQNFSQLPDFISQLGLSFDVEKNRTLITREALVEILNELQPIINVIKHFTWEQICFYEDVGLPDDLSKVEVAALNYGAFSIYGSGTFAVLRKTLNLFYIVKTLINAIEIGAYNQIQVLFYDSY